MTADYIICLWGELESFLSFPVNNLKMAETENGQAISAGKSDYVDYTSSGIPCGNFKY